ncbi:hypothetical protein [Tessaracoccus flavus]|uniref:Uncharacterized protein n=1 Tax=Tessaracoccus flavus TaxID=1610493 RepID=A0A1Q2CDY7_9ACTN|nr:hypothetical protein [Tessaracoccus flavus]AQP44311.1 hypothetical protein RPIT_05370 [Tessaracoccus flavus]SDY65587.1 hypothetical protein SAMN05428934_10321 [Tessaracoccus flavus]
MTPLHGIASRSDLPLPFELVLAGGALVLVLTFWVALFAWKSPRFTERSGTPLPRLTRVVDAPAAVWSLRIVSIALWGLAAAALLFGVDRIDNPVFGFVFVLIWVGLVPVSLLFGTVYRRTNPIRLLLSRWETLNERTTGESWAPAAVALFAFLYLELVQPDGATLPVLRIFTALWFAWLVIGVLVRGPSWIARADPFEAYATSTARLSPWARDGAGTLLAINPLRNLASWRAPRHLALVAAVILGGTLFDALSNSAWWVRATQALDQAVYWPLGLAGLVASIGLIYGLFRLGALPYRDLTADDLAPGLIPLVVGYALAHYGTMLYLEGQRTLLRFSDPLARGWDLFGGAEAAPSTILFAFPTAVAIAQVVLIVGGHAIGVLVTHDIALRTRSRRVAVHLPLLSMMVVFTVGGLLLMFGG